MEPIVIKQKPLYGILYCFAALMLSLLCLVFSLLNFRGEGSSGRGLFAFFIESDAGYIVIKIILGIGFLFFGYCFIFLTEKALRGNAVLIVDENGVTDNSSALSFGFIPWEDVENVYVDGVMGNDFVEVVLRDDNRYINKLGGLKKRAVLANKRLGHQAVCVTLNATGVTPREVISDIQAFLYRAKAK